MADEDRSFPEKTYKMDRTFAAIQYPISPMSMINEQLKSDSGTEAKTDDSELRPEDGNLNN